MTSDAWLGPGFVVLGMILSVLGTVQLVAIFRRRRTWWRCRGEVVDYTWDAHTDIRHWILRWTDADGEIRTARNPTGSSGGTLRQFPFPVDILVDPENPGNAQVAKGSNSGVTACVLMSAVGLLFAGLGVLLIVAA
ncbi:putative membrane protein [Nocardia nova SH22a]|uniref:Putative membrane protein n=1 Tax=Nocardia nova SH22a TaxID=1415166 RepID=W5T8C4_9NOCA|nr:DUF3592 domain-containing protein [Nocardia nova]AHH15585.1 putative membrane protein [Nocardia nova SH22a]